MKLKRNKIKKNINNIEDVDIFETTKTKALSYDFSMHNNVEIIGISDMHVGSECFEVDKFKKIRNYVLAEKNRYVILNGDLVNLGIQQMSGDKDEMTRDEQVYEATQLLLPLAKEGRILSDTDGNHEKRMSRRDFYPSMAIARNLGILDRYREPGNYVHLQVGKNIHGRPSSYFIYHSHGAGGGRTSGSHLESLRRLSSGKEGIDLYIGSHFHEAKILPVSKMFVDRVTRNVTRREEFYVCTGSFIGYESYAERSGMMPNSSAHVFVTLNGKTKNIKAEIKNL